MSNLSPIMLAGTGSDVGKSLIATGLCRVFKQDGLRPAPFKAQNMALNSYATPDGFEIGRAQAVQAEAAGILCSTDMNPLLLKPSGERTSQVVLNGKPIGNRDAYDYFRREGREELRREVHAAFDRLSERYNPIVMEGAGSISELNLRDSDLVNMSMARYADAKVILVADIDRGGVFASVYGSIMLQSEEDKRRIRGVIINKFRGDMRLFDDGCKLMEDLTGVPVLGVVPMMSDIHIEEEDSVSLSRKNHICDATGKVNVAVILHRHISNFTDFDSLERDPRVMLYYASSPEDLSMADIIIIPGSKSTLSDMNDMWRTGMAKAVMDAHDDGKTIFGICGGYQMMGMEVADPDGVEGPIRIISGLRLLPVKTILAGGKVTEQVKFRFANLPDECIGYEIHAGLTAWSDCGDDAGTGHRSLNHKSDGTDDGCFVSHKCMGTYIHGILDNGVVVDYILRPYLSDTIGAQQIVSSKTVSYAEYKESQYDLLAQRLREYIDIPKLYEIMNDDDA